jgi:DNA-binding phage protein
MNKRHKDFNIYLMELLRSPKLARAYLNEALADEDQRVFLIALKNVLACHAEVLLSEGGRQK